MGKVENPTVGKGMYLVVNPYPLHCAGFSSVLGLSLLTLLPCHVRDQRENSSNLGSLNNRFYFPKSIGHKKTKNWPKKLVLHLLQQISSKSNYIAYIELSLHDPEGCI